MERERRGEKILNGLVNWALIIAALAFVAVAWCWAVREMGG